MSLFWIFALSTLLIIALVSVLNTLTFPRLGKRLRRAPGNLPGILPRVSVLVPARDEAGVIGRTVAAILAQDYPGELELIVLDDGSIDGTAQLALQAARGDPRLRLVSGAPLPPGWAGKNWACQQMADQASGDLLVFTDADVRWAPGALRAVTGWMAHSRADCFTVWPTQEALTWPERLVVPMMMFAVLAYLPEVCVRFVPWPVFAAANGQFIAFRRTAYEQVGGHAGVRHSVVEDVSLAWQVKRRGLRLVMSLGDGLISGRMYQSWRQVRHGFAKNILAGHGGSPLFLLFSAVFHWILFLLPWVALLVDRASPAFQAGEVLTEVWLAMIALGLGIRLLIAAATRHRLLDALWLPVSVILLTLIAAQSLWWHYRYGGPQWKGRQIVTRAG
jgi:chlorobactene glucosyltransferase